MTDLIERYGKWALVAGGAQGIGAAYSRNLASAGMNIVALDIATDALEQLGGELKKQYATQFLGLPIDLASPDLLERVTEAVGDREIGLLVYNAGIADVGPFYKADTGLDWERKKLAVNVTGPLLLSYHFARPMLTRRRGGIILMSSGAGMQGSPYYAHYSATRAYNITLAEALWGEFSPYQVDVLACVAGMTLSTAAAGYAHLDTSEFQTPEDLVAEAMAALGRQSTLFAGEAQRRGRAQLQQLPREQQIKLMGQHAIENFLGGTAPEQNL